MEIYCICHLEYHCATIINSGSSLCAICSKNCSRYCPVTNKKITIKLPNSFVRGFFRCLPPSPPFHIFRLLESSDKIAYINQYNKIELDNDFYKLFYSGYEYSLNMYEFKLLLSKCINLDCTNTCGKQLIHYACGSPIYLDIVKYLVINGADVNCTDYDGERPIHNACWKGNEALEVVKYLISQGADVNCADSRRFRYPIHQACSRGDKALEVVKFLILCGANINCIDCDGWRPIHIACHRLNKGEPIELIKYLLANGADPNVRTNDGKLPSDFTKNEEILRLLVKN